MRRVKENNILGGRAWIAVLSHKTVAKRNATILIQPK